MYRESSSAGSACRGPCFWFIDSLNGGLSVFTSPVLSSLDSTYLSGSAVGTFILHVYYAGPAAARPRPISR